MAQRPAPPCIAMARRQNLCILRWIYARASPDVSVSAYGTRYILCLKQHLGLDIKV